MAVEIKCDGCGNVSLLYTPVEAQERLDRSENTINRHRSTGWLEGTRIGSGYYYTEGQITEGIRLQEQRESERTSK